MLNDHAWKCSGNGTIGPLMSGGWRGSNTQEMMLVTDTSVYYGNSISTSLCLDAQMYHQCLINVAFSLLHVSQSERSGVQNRVRCATVDADSVQIRFIRNQESKTIKTPGYRILSPICYERRHMQTMRHVRNRFVG